MEVLVSETLAPVPRLKAGTRLAFAGVLAALLLGGLWFYESERQRLQAAAEANLEAIAKLKVEQIVRWRAERRSDGLAIMDNPALAAGLDRLLTAKGRSAADPSLSSQFRTLQRAYGYDDVLLADASGAVRLSLSGVVGPLHEVAARARDEAMRTRRPVLTDIHAGPAGRPAHVDVVAPIWVGAREEATGAVVLRSDSQKFLYPLIQTWPLPSVSAETLLVRRDGEAALFLNPLRYRSDAALTLRIPLSRRDVPAVMAIGGQEGVVRGTDYRGVDVFSYMKKVPDSPWFIVAKIDTSEVLTGWHALSRLLLGILLAAIVATFALLFALSQRSVAEHLRARLRVEAARVEVEERFRLFFDEAPVGKSITAPGGQLMRVNLAFCRMLGYTAEEMQRLSFAAITHPDDLAESREGVRAMLAGERDAWEARKRYLAKDGRLVWTHVSTRLARDGQGQPLYFLTHILDIDDRKRAEQRLSDLSSRQEAMLAAIPDIIMEVDNSKIYTWANRAGLEFFGEDAIGREAAHYFVGEQDTYGVVRPLFMGSEDVLYVESWQRRRDGEKRLLAWWCRVLKDSSGNVTGALSSARDITEQMRAEEALRESEERFRRIFEEGPIGMAVTSADSHFARANVAFCRMLGYTEQELAALTFRDITHPEHIAQDAEAVSHVADGSLPVYRTEKRYVRKDHGTVWGALTVATVRSQTGQILHFLAMIEDVTERKRAEDEVRRLNEQLEQRVRERTAELEAANKELESFAYSVSHDLRAPLRGIDGWSLALLDDHGDRLGGEAREQLQRVRAEAQRMGRLIDDLLRLSRVARAQMQRGPVDLSALAHEVVARLRTDQNRRQVEVFIQPGLTAEGDGALLETVLTNLLGNAWKFTSTRARARIELGRVEVDGHAAFFVRDNGVGFDMAFSHKLFGPFQRLHKASEFPGTGIGLASVQRIVRRHGGRAWAEAEVGRGATFYFTLEGDA